MKRISAVMGCYSEPQPGFAETNDCGVRALAVAACITYAAAHALCEAAGRKYRAGMYVHQMAKAVRRAAPLGSRIYDNRVDGNVTLGRHLASGALDRGHFVVLVTGHYIAVVDGIVHNWGTLGSRTRVLDVWQLV